jgi:hypothetical protein
MFDAVNIKTSRRFWKCLKCPKESPFIGQIYRVEDHLMKLHTKLINLRITAVSVHSDVRHGMIW